MSAAAQGSRWFPLRHGNREPPFLTDVSLRHVGVGSGVAGSDVSKQFRAAGTTFEPIGRKQLRAGIRSTWQ